MFCRSVGWIYRPIHPPPLPSPIIEKVNCVGRSVTETLRVVQSLNQVDRASGRELTPADWKPGQPTIVNTIPGIHNYYSRLQRSERVESYWTTKFNLWFYNHQVLLCEYSCEKPWFNGFSFNFLLQFQLKCFLIQCFNIGYPQSTANLYCFHPGAKHTHSVYI